MDGATGEDLVLKVPVGTLIFDQNEERLLFDIVEHGQKEVLAHGGRGGLGNAFFKSSTNQAPRHAQEGEEGEAFSLKLELKLIADIALIGLPNAGKSTLYFKHIGRQTKNRGLSLHHSDAKSWGR